MVLSPPSQTDWVLFIKHTGSLMLQGPVLRCTAPPESPAAPELEGGWGCSGAAGVEWMCPGSQVVYVPVVQ